ncbi:hypothetical protein CAEBREN_11389 [Caenorhabditis brenneri]|uniref:SET domain-containing protein n=1 Tax=Caenorhabditis brenneri TaxID=135651 RepID=G0M6I3_CAEBE|nr:hypothetical protein CAEBREN_11389 [Caenorhabditis brenneri]
MSSMKLRERNRRIETYIKPSPTRISPYWCVSIKNREAQHDLYKNEKRKHPFGGTERTSEKRAKTLDTVHVISINQRIPYLPIQYPDPFFFYERAIQHQTRRNLVLPKSSIKLISDAQLEQIVDQVLDTIRQIVSLEKCRELNSRKGEEILRKERVDSTLAKYNKARRKIEMLPKRSTILKPDLDQIEMRINSHTSIFVDRQNLSDALILPKSAFFQYIGENVIGEEFPKAFLKAAKSLEEMKKDKNSNQHYSCSKACPCKGKCANSFPEPPVNNIEIRVHPQKGCVTVSTHYCGQGETAVEFRGVFRETEKMENNDSYAFDSYCVKNEQKLTMAILEQNNKLNLSDRVKGLTATYQNTLKKVMETDLSLDPRTYGNRGRYISHSCFPNLKINSVYSEGLSPLNKRTLLTSIMPVFPNEEFTFFYGFGYLLGQLKDTCLCGEIGCIRNRELYPFLTREDIKRFYKASFEDMYHTYMQNVHQNAQRRTAP